MATKKKAKKAKKTKKTKKKTARKKMTRKPARKKTASKKRTKAKSRPKSKAKPKPKLKSEPKTGALKQAPAPGPMTPPPGERIGTVTHYFNHLSVAIIHLDAGSLRVGEVVHIKGHTTDFKQQVDSMEINHVNVNEARPGDSFGLRVRDHAREHDVVYKVTQ